MSNLQLQMAIEGNLTAYMQAQAKGVARAVTGAVRVTTFGVQRELKRQIKRARFKSPGLEKTIISKVKPRRGYEPDAEGVVYSVANVKRTGGPVDIIEAFDKGVTISAKGGRWLAIPTTSAPIQTLKKTGATRMRPGAVRNVLGGASASSSTDARRHASRRASDFKMAGLDTLHFVPSRDPNLASLQYKSGATGKAIVAYWLVKQVKIRKRLNIDAAKAKWLPKLAGRINKNLDRISGKIGILL